MSECVLQVVELVKEYQKKKVVNGLSFHVEKGQVVGLLGPNGAGKTTAFYMTVGLIRPDAGKVFFQGKDVTLDPIHKRARHGMGYLAQEPSVFRSLTVEQNILCILENLIDDRIEKQKRLEELLEELRISHLSKKMASTLSGGERRRVEIARSLATNPTCLMLDEPFANIDPISVHEVKDLIRQLALKGISILITDHNAREIFSVVDKSYLICDGKVLLSGSVEELMQSADARKVYLGESFRM